MCRRVAAISRRTDVGPVIRQQGFNLQSDPPPLGP